MQCFYEDPNYKAFTNDFTTKVGVANNAFTGSCIEACQHEEYAYAAVHTGYQKLKSSGGNAAYHHNMTLYPANQCHCGYVQGLYGQPSNRICQTPYSDEDEIKHYSTIAGGDQDSKPVAGQSSAKSGKELNRHSGPLSCISPRSPRLGSGHSSPLN